ncbi:MAG: DNA polymerase/3'-5' exonuclease PolX [Deltaproteobacteria bacterium]|nr:DNA polymerase/3'-5' exonuclease PolX [Deltaproteobacteria bacterium]
MPIHNHDIADIFERVADLLEIEGANPFRVRAYRNAARVVDSMSQSLADLAERGEDFTDLPGVGKDLAGKIQEIIKTGDLEMLKELEARTPPALAVLMNVGGLGPKRVHLLHEELGVTTAEDLKEAAQAGKIKELKGFGPKIEQMVLESLANLPTAGKRFKLVTVEPVAESLVRYLQKVPGVDEAIVAGSYRRRLETVGDLDILTTCKDAARVMDAFVSYEDAAKVVAKGDTKSTLVLRNGLQVDLRAVAKESYGAALHYFTGSKAHNIAIRHLGVQRGLKINEYGVFQGDKRVAGKTEEEVYKMVDLPFIEPELREDRGEIEAARQGKLPKLITLEDIRGDLHAHTKATDGRNSLEEMAQAAKERGYEYLAITNHSKRVSMAHGHDAKNLAAEIAEIDRLNAKLDGIILLKAIELDILEDGSLDLEDDILKELDLTVCAAHYHHNLPREKQTARILKAMDNPYFNILAHPSGRLIHRRDPSDLDMERLIKAAKERGCFMELDAQPDRLDLIDIHCKLAKDVGVKVSISTDAHSTSDLGFMRWGIGQARRGWLEADDVLNTRSWPELKKLLKRV